MHSRQRGALVLEGMGKEGIFPGELFGAQNWDYRKDRGFGEAVFNTSMTGYQEILTDPSYFGEIVCMTVAHLGNTGVNASDPESARIWCAGLVVQELSELPSNWRSEGTLDYYLVEAGVPALKGVDTRAVTRILRSRGACRALIMPENRLDSAAQLFRELPLFEGRDLIQQVTTKSPYQWSGGALGKGADGCSAASPKRWKVAVLDFGVKWNLLRELEARGCELQVFPANASLEDLMRFRPDGVFLSNGPGDPAAAPYAVETVRKLVGTVPIFGVCMGHQILAIAMGARTYKLKFGHRGGNQPVSVVSTGKVEISSHNHGYAVDSSTMPREVRSTHTNLNDGTCEGLEVIGQSAFSVQYHPEACPGPHDSRGLFDQFIALLKESQLGRRNGHVSKVP